MENTKKFWNTSSGKVMRWIGLLPVSIAAAIVAGFLVRILNIIQSFFSADDPQWALIGSPIVATLALFYVAYIIAPSYKKIVFYILLALRIINTLIWLLFPTYAHVSFGMLFLQEALTYILIYFLYTNLFTSEND